MDFFYRNNLNKVDFLSCLQTCKNNEQWSVLQFGFPSLFYDAQRNEISLVFAHIESKQKYFRQNLLLFKVVPNDDNSILLLESINEYDDYAISFNLPESLNTFFRIYQEISLHRFLNRQPN